MKNFSFFSFSLLLLVCSITKGQGIYDNPLQEKKQLAFYPKIFIGPSVGVNNISGMIGVLAELHVYKKITIAGGLGMGSWGGKYSVQARYYRRYPVGVFYGIGLTTATGAKDYEMELEVKNEEDLKKVKMDLHKINCINITIGQHLRLGKRMRLNFELGYAIPLQNDFYEIKTSGVELTKTSEQQMDLLTPGGLIVGAAFSLAIK